MYRALMLVLSFAVASSFGMFAPFFAVGQLGLFAIQVGLTIAAPLSLLPHAHTFSGRARPVPVCV